MRGTGLLLSAVLGLSAFVPDASAQIVGHATARYEWRITKDHWDENDERRFGEFVARLGESRCNNTDRCLRSEANPYRDTDPPTRSGRDFDRENPLFKSDCADFPYVLRAYFAAKNGLPFSYVNGVRANPDSRLPRRPLRYNREGNHVSSRLDIVASGSSYPNLYRVLRQITGTISTATFRMNRTLPNSGARFSDVYPVDINRETIRPGTTIYDPAGHVAIVYKVDDDGQIHFMDGHPDNSVTRGTYNGDRFNLGRPSVGSGLNNFRPLRLVGYSTAADGSLIGGRVVAPSDDELREQGLYSLVQYYGTEGGEDWRRARFRVGGAEMENFFEFVRGRLVNGELRYDPVREFTLAVNQFCADVRDRVDAVNVAIASGIQNQAHPEELPSNIYGTEGDWETYSSPSRDARLRSALRGLRLNVERWVNLVNARDPRVVYTGQNLAADLLRIFYTEDQNCQVAYTKSDGTAQTLRLTEVLDRVFRLSFDPYHCAELRWGAQGSELASCNDNRNKRDWYEAEEILRNQLERNYDVAMDMNLRELRQHARELRSGQARPRGTGVARPVDVDFEAYLLSLRR